MKNFILLIGALLVVNFSFAKIWRVNNNPALTADFTTAQAANDAATVLTGDTIHLEPSATSYGYLTTNKRLVWLSTGSFLGAHPGEQYAVTPGRVDGLSVYAGSANSIFSINIDGGCNLSAPNVGLIRCYVTGSIALNTYSPPGPANDVVMNCYVTGALLVYSGSNHNISNNIFGDYLYTSPGSSSFIMNNIFNAYTTSYNTVDNATLQNNIFNKTANPMIFTNSVVEYNMSGNPGILPAANNNQNNVNMSTVFVNNNGITDTSFVLKPGSPASGTGVGGVDMGAYGGGTPFKIALQPAIPAIYKILAPVAPTGNTMNVTFSTKSNN
jgi:hypothetical protein